MIRKRRRTADASELRVRAAASADTETPAPVKSANSASKQQSKSSATSSIDFGGSIEEQTARFQDWNKSGCPHDDFCLECHKTVDLLHCYTCRKSYHEGCLLAPASYHLRNSQFYCIACILRRWDYSSPATIRASPPSLDVSEKSSNKVAVNPNHAAHALSSSVAESSQRQSKTRGPPRAPSHDPSEPNLAIESPARNRKTRSRPQNGAISPRILPGLGTSGGSNSVPRSRFSVLHREVDDAVSIVLREVEYSMEASQCCAQLKEVVRKLEQEAKISRNARVLAEKATAAAIANHQSSFTAAQYKALEDQVKLLSKQLALKDDIIQDLQSRLEKAQSAAGKHIADLESKAAEMEEWKAKMRHLLS